MLGIRIQKGKAEGLRKYLKRNGNLNSKYRVFSSNSFIYFPLVEPPDIGLGRKLEELEAKTVDKDFKPIRERMRRTAGAPEGAAHGYDLYGNIAVIDAEPDAARKMAAGLMLSNKNIKTVLRKGSAVRGRYRTRKFLFVSGKKNYLATYRENGCILKFDIRKVFFSTRLAYERKRVGDLVRDGENVIVMFAGVGPYAIEIAKSHKKCSVVAIELNKTACKYMRENIALNKTENVVCEEGDVNEFAGKYRGFADRIIMPLPKGALNFLPAAIRMRRRKCIIHYYLFCDAEKIDDSINSIKSFFTKRGVGIKLLGYRIVRPYSSTIVEIALDMRLS